MSQSSNVGVPQQRLTSTTERNFSIILWAAAALAGFLQSFAERFYIEPDEVNYLDIAYGYVRHDFHNAVNVYLSPLYCWLLAVVICDAPFCVLGIHCSACGSRVVGCLHEVTQDPPCVSQLHKDGSPSALLRFEHLL